VTVSSRAAEGESSATSQREAIKDLDELPCLRVYKRFLHTQTISMVTRVPCVFTPAAVARITAPLCLSPTFSGHTMPHPLWQRGRMSSSLSSARCPETDRDAGRRHILVNKPRTLDCANELIRRGNKLPFDANCRPILARRGNCFHVAQGRCTCSALASKA